MDMRLKSNTESSTRRFMYLIPKLVMSLVLFIIMNGILHAAPPNANIIIVKTVINDNGGNATVSNFGITTTAGTPVFTTPPTGTHPTYIYTSNILSVPSKTNITINEIDLFGYTEGSWNCAGTTGPASGVTVNLNPNSTVTCTITNNDIVPTLTLLKTVINDGGGTAVDTAFTLSFDNGAGASGSGIEGDTAITNVNVPAGNYTLTESALAGYALDSIACDGTDINGLDGLNISLGENVSCTFTNNDQLVDLRITKSVDNPVPNIGETVTFTLLVENLGPDVATAVSATDSVPAGFIYTTSTIAGGDSRNASGANLSWTINSLASSANTTLTFQAVVQAP